MSEQYDNTNKGVLFKNAEKESDKHPDYRGDIDIGGTKYWLSAWINTSKKGTKYMSLAVKAKEQMQPDQTPHGGDPNRAEEPFDDSLPF